MENNSIFLSKTAEWLEGLGLSNVSEYEAILILLAALLVLFLIFWLVFRKARLWYWKTDLQIDTLKSIDNRLNNMENKLSETVSLSSASEKENGTPAAEEEGPVSDAEIEKVKLEEEGLTATGRSGRIYTEAELETQIRE